MEKCYSTDAENYVHTEVDDVLDALDNEGRLVVGEVYYEMDSEPVDLAQFLDASQMLENAEERLWGEIGEAAEDAYAVGKEAIAELDAVLDAWVKKHLNGMHWRCVGKPREVRVTSDDVAEHAR